MKKVLFLLSLSTWTLYTNNTPTTEERRQAFAGAIEQFIEKNSATLTASDEMALAEVVELLKETPGSESAAATLGALADPNPWDAADALFFHDERFDILQALMKIYNELPTTASLKNHFIKKEYDAYKTKSFLHDRYLKMDPIGACLMYTIPKERDSLMYLARKMTGLKSHVYYQKIDTLHYNLRKKSSQKISSSFIATINLIIKNIPFEELLHANLAWLYLCTNNTMTYALYELLLNVATNENLNATVKQLKEERLPVERIAEILSSSAIIQHNGQTTLSELTAALSPIKKNKHQARHHKIPPALLKHLEVITNKQLITKLYLCGISQPLALINLSIATKIHSSDEILITVLEKSIETLIQAITNEAPSLYAFITNPNFPFTTNFLTINTSLPSYFNESINELYHHFFPAEAEDRKKLIEIGKNYAWWTTQCYFFTKEKMEKALTELL